MTKIIGGILSVGGIAGVLFFGYQYLQDTESFQVFGAEIAVTTGDIVPILISAIALIAGLLIYRSGR